MEKIDWNKKIYAINYDSMELVVDTVRNAVNEWALHDDKIKQFYIKEIDGYFCVLHPYINLYDNNFETEEEANERIMEVSYSWWLEDESIYTLWWDTLEQAIEDYVYVANDRKEDNEPEITAQQVRECLKAKYPEENI